MDKGYFEKISSRTFIADELYNALRLAANWIEKKDPIMVDIGAWTNEMDDWCVAVFYETTINGDDE